MDVRPSGRRTSIVVNPFLLPEFDEENYDPSTESGPNFNEEMGSISAPTIWQKGGGVSFKKSRKGHHSTEKMVKCAQGNVLV